MEPQLSIINLESLKAIVGDDADMVQEVVNLFLEQMPQYIQELEHACNGKDCVGIAKIAHTIKGSASYLGAERVVMIAKALESKAKDNNYIECEQLFIQMQEGFENIRQYLTKKI